MIISRRLLTVVAVVGLALAACASDPPVERKSELELLNGERYDPGTVYVSNPTSLAVPINMKVKPRSTVVSGTIWQGEGIGRVAVPHASIKIWKNVSGAKSDEPGKPLAETVSGPQGSYKIVQLIPNGDYKITVQRGENTVSIPLFVDRYELTNIDLNLP